MENSLSVGDGQLTYEIAGEGPLVVMVHGMGDNRAAFRFLAPRLVSAGYRVAAMDLRGHGGSTPGWSSYTRTDTAGDILALVRHLGGPAVIVGHSFAGGSATIAAAEAPKFVSAIVEIAPFTRVDKMAAGALLRNAHHRRGMLRLFGAVLLRSPRLWRRYLEHNYQARRPAHHAAAMDALQAELRRPGRMAAVSAMGRSAPADAGARLGDVRCPALVVVGTADPDWPDPRAAAERAVADMPQGLGTVVTIDGAGHYPHTQFPDEVAAAVIPFLKEHAGA
ncbi:alpha/beta hydrolase [Nonomuraea sp. KC401]|uniref:alpha/beta fold hydrolase n=1 Tax=unclassified Nonomuraea TaxID=2593643 RepID=UPI0010FD8A84|nr:MULTISPECIES: alpha/beta hydrolase [unclassified Nonomuraea]NBE96568.1 alpha/beta fold hydrolase [Nonomuraea sp. K271]TLF86330.1 alpha/beta hydrolase [Nonomuraea sp. KC401]